MLAGGFTCDAGIAHRVTRWPVEFGPVPGRSELLPPLTEVRATIEGTR